MASKRPVYDNDDEGSSRRKGLDPLVAALLGHLPPAHTVWPPQDRQKWMDMLGDAFAVIYKDAEPPKGASDAKPAPGSVRTP